MHNEVFKYVTLPNNNQNITEDTIHIILSEKSLSTSIKVIKE